jgi:hypothetical protein
LSRSPENECRTGIENKKNTKPQTADVSDHEPHNFMGCEVHGKTGNPKLHCLLSGIVFHAISYLGVAAVAWLSLDTPSKRAGSFFLSKWDRTLSSINIANNSINLHSPRFTELAGSRGLALCFRSRVWGPPLTQP